MPDTFTDADIATWAFACYLNAAERLGLAPDALIEDAGRRIMTRWRENCLARVAAFGMDRATAEAFLDAPPRGRMQ